jgi:PAS domain S-box-containing protein
MKQDHKKHAPDYKTFFDRSVDALIVLDSISQEILMANDAVPFLLGFEKDEIIGRPFSILHAVGSLDTAQPLSAYDSVISCEFSKKNGAPVVLDMTAALIPWGEGQGILVTLRDASERIKAEREREKLIEDLEDALEKIRTLKGLLPICAFCKKIRDDQGYWEKVETYIEAHSDAEFSHSICPECAKKHYPEVFKK